MYMMRPVIGYPLKTGEAIDSTDHERNSNENTKGEVQVLVAVARWGL